MVNKRMALGLISIFGVLFLSFSNLYAQENDFVEIHLKKAGKLSSELKKINNCANLKINGPLNGTDFVKLKELCFLGLEKLDLTDAQIIPGGKVLHTIGKQKYKVEQNNVLCNYSLSGFKRLQVLVLPNNIEGIEEYALANSPNVSVIYFTSLTPSTNLSLSVHRSALNCNKILVPGERYYTYKQLLPGTYTKKIFKGDAPSEYNIHVSPNHRLLGELEGGFDFVKNLTISGELNGVDLEVLKLLGNLELLDLSDATIYDRRLKEYIDDYVDILVPKTEEFLDIENAYEVAQRKKQFYINNLQNEIKSIELKKIDLEKRRKQVIEKQGELAFLSLLFGLTEEEVNKQHRSGEMNELEYQYNSQFISQAQKELSELDIAKDQDLADDDKYNKLQSYHNDLIKSLNDSLNRSKTILEYNDNISVLKSELQPFVDEYNLEQKQMRDYLNANSSIPNNFLNNPILKRLVLPKNTVIIAPEAFIDCPSDIDVVVDREMLKIDGRIINEQKDNDTGFKYDMHSGKNKIGNGYALPQKLPQYFKDSQTSTFKF